jgi:hypothetical protein
MGMTLNFINIPNQKQDIDNISKFIKVTNAGIEAITNIYDDHTLDQNISTRAFFLQENLIYRIYAAFHQYELLIEGMNRKSVIDLITDPFEGEDPLHPKAYQYSAELSSIVDSIFFHLCSAFDYFGHFISYMFEKNKDRTLDWGSLAKTARASYKTRNMKIGEAIQEVDVQTRIPLDKYRGELIHRKRDLRRVGMNKNEDANELSLIYAASPETMKHFKNFLPKYDPESNYTLDFLPSAVFYRSLESINYLLDYIRIDLIAETKFSENVKNKKRADFKYNFDVVRNIYYPQSEQIWHDYKSLIQRYCNKYERRKKQFENRLK